MLLRFLQTFGRIVEALVRRGGVPHQDLMDALTFLETFGDVRHHEKEENCLFAHLRHSGRGRASLPAAALTEEHRRGRELLRAIRDHAAAAAGGDPGSVRAVAHMARELVDAQIDHIEKEDRILFPLVDELLHPEEQRRILRGFEAATARDTEPSLGELKAIAARLRREYGPGDDDRDVLSGGRELGGVADVRPGTYFPPE